MGIMPHCAIVPTSHDTTLSLSGKFSWVPSYRWQRVVMVFVQPWCSLFIHDHESLQPRNRFIRRTWRPSIPWCQYHVIARAHWFLHNVGLRLPMVSGCCWFQGELVAWGYRLAGTGRSEGVGPRCYKLIWLSMNQKNLNTAKRAGGGIARSV
jgi:hypothetical protein